MWLFPCGSPALLLVRCPSPGHLALQCSAGLASSAVLSRSLPCALCLPSPLRLALLVRPRHVPVRLSSASGDACCGCFSSVLVCICVCVVCCRLVPALPFCPGRWRLLLFCRTRVRPPLYCDVPLSPRHCIRSPVVLSVLIVFPPADPSFAILLCRLAVPILCNDLVSGGLISVL